MTKGNVTGVRYGLGELKGKPASSAAQRVCNQSKNKAQGVATEDRHGVRTFGVVGEGSCNSYDSVGINNSLKVWMSLQTCNARGQKTGRL
jgi:hypothetical protein